MSNKLYQQFEKSRPELINLALTSAGLKEITNQDTNTQDSNRAAQKFYNYAISSLLAKAPWNFATKRRRLDLIPGESPVDSYNYFYEIPEDALYLWDIYNRGAATIKEIYFWDVSIRYSYYSFPLDNNLVFGGGVGEVIGGRIASNYRELSVFYTRNEEPALNKVSQQFYDILLLDLEELLVKYRATDEEKLRMRLDTNEKHKRTALARAGNENRESRKIPEANIIQNLKAASIWS